MTSQAEPVVGADFKAADVLHRALTAFTALIEYPNHVRDTPRERWALLRNMLETYAINHGYDERAKPYGDFNIRLSTAQPGDKIQTFLKLNHLLDKIEEAKRYLESPDDLKQAMDKMEEIYYDNPEDIEAFIDALFNNINHDITILMKHGKF